MSRPQSAPPDMDTIWQPYLHRYGIYLKLERSMSDNTVAAYRHDVERFADFLSARYPDTAPTAVTPDMVEAFLAELFDEGMEKRSQSRMLSGLNSFFDFLLRTDVIAQSPTELVEHPKSGQYLPDTLTIDEIDAILEAIDLSAPQGYRNRAIIETLYSCGLRVSELVTLHISDLFLDEGYLRVRGKGDKQRLIPVGEACRQQLDNYLHYERPQPADAASADTVFLNRRGRPLSRVMVFNIIKAAVAEAGIHKEVSPHTFRHSFATHLLQGGANIRQVQALLGHESITTTEIYTHLDTSHLHSAVNEFHPLGKRARKR